MVSTPAFHARVRGSVPGLNGLKETKMFLPHPRVNVSIVGNLCDREVAISISTGKSTYGIMFVIQGDLQGQIQRSNLKKYYFQ